MWLLVLSAAAPQAVDVLALLPPPAPPPHPSAAQACCQQQRSWPAVEAFPLSRRLQPPAWLLARPPRLALAFALRNAAHHQAAATTPRRNRQRRSPVSWLSHVAVPDYDQISTTLGLPFPPPTSAFSAGSHAHKYTRTRDTSHGDAILQDLGHAGGGARTLEVGHVFLDGLLLGEHDAPDEGIHLM